MNQTIDKSIKIGMNARFPPFGSHTPLEEIAFARSSGFECVQFAVREPGDYAARLGAPLEILGQALRAANLTSVMEIVVRIDQAGRNAIGQTPLEALQTNLPSILALQCTCVHWHLVPMDANMVSASLLQDIEETLVTQFAAGVTLADSYGFHFGFEHNDPSIPLFATPVRCASMLEKVSGLGFVWDFNHTVPEHLDSFLQLTPRMTMLHVSDTPLPIVNYHLPLGKGRIDFARYCQELQKRGFSGPAILEVGGLPQSGGYGQDTDTALLHSRERLADAIQEAENFTSNFTSTMPE